MKMLHLSQSDKPKWYDENFAKATKNPAVLWAILQSGNDDETVRAAVANPAVPELALWRLLETGWPRPDLVFGNPTHGKKLQEEWSSKEQSSGSGANENVLARYPGIEQLVNFVAAFWFEEQNITLLVPQGMHDRLTILPDGMGTRRVEDSGVAYIHGTIDSLMDSAASEDNLDIDLQWPTYYSGFRNGDVIDLEVGWHWAVQTLNFSLNLPRQSTNGPVGIYHLYHPRDFGFELQIFSDEFPATLLITSAGASSIYSIPTGGVQEGYLNYFALYHGRFSSGRNLSREQMERTLNGSLERVAIARDGDDIFITATPALPAASRVAPIIFHAFRDFFREAAGAGQRHASSSWFDEIVTAPIRH